MLKSSGAMGAATLASRVLGMLRETVYAGFMGDGPVAGAFKMALVIPNLFRRLLGEGALTAAFIPIFKEKERKEGEAEMWKAANAVVSGLVIAACLIIGVVVLGISIYLSQTQEVAGEFSKGVAQALPGINTSPNTTDVTDTRLMLELSRIMFPYMLLVCLAAIFMGMLNARGHFFVPALGATVLNLILIGSVFLVAPRFGDTLDKQIFGLAFAILVAGAAQAFFQLPVLYKEGFRLRWVSPWANPTVKQVIRKMIPGMMGVAAFQINVLFTQGLAFTVNSSMIASFDYAVRLMELPQGLFAISLATYLLPTLSGLSAEKKYDEFSATYKQGIGYILFINLIASVLLLVLAEPMIRLIFQHGKFDALSTQRAAFALTFLAPGLLAFSVVNITARAYYALGDTQTPMKISAVCLVLNMVFAFVLIEPMEQGGMALANTLSAIFNVYLLLFGLKKKLARLNFADLRATLLPMVGAALAAGIVAWLTMKLWNQHIGHVFLWQRFGEVFLPITAAMVVYLGLLYWSGLPQARDILGMIQERFAKKKKRE
ncbi:MAG: murein biosynthesis integral membrane protein MurJ [Verrucomicrobiales bacterium]